MTEKRYINDGLGMRLMRGQENQLGQMEDITCTCCGFTICAYPTLSPVDPGEFLPPGWAPAMGGYVHPSGAEVQRRGGKWAWFRKGTDTCALRDYKDTLAEALIAAAPRWSQVTDDDGREVYLKGLVLVHPDDDIPHLWRNNVHTAMLYMSPEAAMLAAERDHPECLRGVVAVNDWPVAGPAPDDGDF